MPSPFPLPEGEGKDMEVKLEVGFVDLFARSLALIVTHNPYGWRLGAWAQWVAG